MIRVRYWLMMLLCLMVASNGGAQSLRDPTMPIERLQARSLEDSDGSNVDAGTKHITVQGLFISKSKRVALINGKLYVIGDYINAAKLVAIFKDRIVIKQGQNMKVVFFIPNEVRQ